MTERVLNSPRKLDVEDTLEVVVLSHKERKRYDIHGLAIITLHPKTSCSFVIDLDELRDPKRTWVRRLTHHTVTIIVSSDKQKGAKPKQQGYANQCIELKKIDGKNLEGLNVQVHFAQARIAVPPNVKLLPFYSNQTE